MKLKNEPMPPGRNRNFRHETTAAGQSPCPCCKASKVPTWICQPTWWWRLMAGALRQNTTGELVAEAIHGVGGSGRFYRALTKACLDAGVDLMTPMPCGILLECATGYSDAARGEDWSRKRKWQFSGAGSPKRSFKLSVSKPRSGARVASAPHREPCPESVRGCGGGW